MITVSEGNSCKEANRAQLAKPITVYIQAIYLRDQI